MAEQQALKIFISWSGALSKAVAVALRGWLPLLFDNIDPFASEIDIAPGERGLKEIEKELEGTQFGIVCVTQENQRAPWLNFEAGALSKVVDVHFQSRVVPIMIDLDSASELDPPLGQFQAKALNQDGVLDLVRSIALLVGVKQATIDERFESQWQKLSDQIEGAKKDHASDTRPAKRSERELLTEVLGHVRALRSASRSDGDVAERWLRKSIGAPKTLSRARTQDVVVTSLGERPGEVKSYTVTSAPGASPSDFEQFVLRIMDDHPGSTISFTTPPDPAEEAEE